MRDNRAPLPPGLLARGWFVTLLYTAAALVMTWPLARGIAHDVAWDLGDSLLNMWILAWDATQLGAILRGDVGRLRTFFDANIFYPERLTLAYSEHLIGQALQILPVYLATKNPILCYNLLFLSTFVLGGLGTYLFVRELTGSHRAAFVAGLMFAFAPYRLAQSSHLQVMSSQWMPFALYGLRRYFVSGRRTALAGSAAAVVMQSLSCGYYLLYFTPFFVLYAVWEIGARGIWARKRLWIELAAAGALAAAVTVVLFLPYLDVRQRLGGMRSIGEVVSFSADAYGYLTASTHNRLWGPIVQAFFRAEGELFPGVLPLACALAAVLLWLGSSIPASADAAPARVDRPIVAAASLVIGALALGVFVVLVFERRISIDLGPFAVRASDVTRPLIIAAVCVLVAAATSGRVRSALRRIIRRPEAVLVVMCAGAWWLSLGPRPTSLGRPLNLAAPYALLFEHVPGFEGVRAPARYAMIGALALSVLAGLGLAAVDGAARWRRVLIAVIALAFLGEAAVVPFLLNGASPNRDFNSPEPRVYRPERAPAVYGAAAAVPNPAVVIELPFGDPEYDLRAVYYSIVHWHPLVNGYSGLFPPHYGRYGALFTDVDRHAALSTDALRLSGATHVIVHEAAYRDGEGRAVVEWLRGSGAVEVFRDGSDALFQLPGGARP